MRTPLIAGNWKMFKTVHEAVAFAKEFKSLVAGVTGVDIVLAPLFTAVHAVAEAVRATNIAVSSQDLFWEKARLPVRSHPAWCVKPAPSTLSMGIRNVGVLGDTDVMINRKVLAALNADLTPVVCVGETLEEREGNKTFDVLDRQVKGALESVAPEQVANLTIAYEPVWAIGTGRNATATQAQEAHAHIRARLRQWFGAETAEQCRILYGGSVKPDNAAELLREPRRGWCTAGGASLDVAGFGKIVAAARPAVV
ncbi:MAG: triose-phosphate isomerase [Vicinamibacterales bacterium]